MNVVKRPPEEYFLIGSKQLDDFKAVKVECYAEKRVMKRAGDAYFFGGAGISPGKRAKSGTVRSELARGNPTFTSILEDYGEEKNSQELLAMCVAQTDVL
jgi:hypothetical protein